MTWYRSGIALFGVCLAGAAAHATTFDPSKFDMTPKAAKVDPGVHLCWSGSSIISLRDPFYAKCIKSLSGLQSSVSARREQLLTTSDYAGCLSRDAVTCLASLSTTLVLTNDAIWPNMLDIPTHETRDIDGKLIEKSIFAQAFIPHLPHDQQSRATAIKVSITLGQSLRVNSIDFDLPAATNGAKTVDDWNQTGVFEIVSGVLGPKCAGDNRADFYRKYETAEKAANPFEGFDPTGYSSGAATNIRMCGASLQIGSGGGVHVDSGHSYGSWLRISDPDSVFFK